jgi:hypothetical protein
MEHLDTVGKHGRTSFACVELSVVHFAHVRDEIGFSTSRRKGELSKSIQELLIGDRVKRARLFHTCNIRRGFSSLGAAALATQFARSTSGGVRRDCVKPCAAVAF